MKTGSSRRIFLKGVEPSDLGNAHTVQGTRGIRSGESSIFSEEHQYIQTVWGKGYKFVVLNAEA